VSFEDRLLTVNGRVFRRTIEDKYTGKNLLLNDEELDIIQKIQQREFPDASVDHYPVRLLS